MKRFALVSLVLICSMAFTATAFAGARNAGYEEFFFGDSFHKSPAGIHVNYMNLKWDANGVTEFKYQVSAWKGKLVWDDLYFVGSKDGNPVIVFKLSDKQKMGKEFCYLDCKTKSYLDTMFVAPAAGPFDGETGQVWFVFSHGGQVYHIVWDIKSNQRAWHKAEDKPAPPALTK